MNNKHYIAKKGYTYKRIIDNFVMGNELYLGDFIDGTEDVITNYEEVIDNTPKDDTPNKNKKNIHKR